MDWNALIPDFFRFGSKDKPFFSKGFSFFSAAAVFNSYGSDMQKLKMAFKNPALCKVIALQCDLFALGKVYVYKNGKEVENDPFLDMIEQPNNFQSRSQWLWDFMFWNMIGNAYLYMDSNAVTDQNKLYWLVPTKIEFPQAFEKAKDKLILSKKSQSEIDALQIRYKYNDGTGADIPWSKIIHYADLTNGVGNWFKGNSRIEALAKVIDNSEEAIRSKNVNLRFTARFLLGGVNDVKDVTKRPLSEPEKEDLIDKSLHGDTVSAVRNMFELKRFVEDMGKLKLDEAFEADFFKIGTAYNIPKNVLETYLSDSTFENQEKARGAHVSYCLEPKSESLWTPIKKRIQYKNKTIMMSWDHCPFMQVFENDRMLVSYRMSQALLNLQAAGASLDDINEVLDTKFKDLKPISQNVRQPEQQGPTAGPSNQQQPGDPGGQQSATA